jgi:hypothetical protein
MIDMAIGMIRYDGDRYDRYCGRPSPDESGEQLLFLTPNKVATTAVVLSLKV